MKTKSLKGTLLLLATVLFAVSPVYSQRANEDISDADITSAVVADLFADSRIPVNDIDVETKDGVVQLSGKVNNIYVKDQTQDVAESIVGVRAVVNMINVSPADTIDDGQIKDDIEAALLFDPATNSENIDANVTVNDGAVTLSGTASSWQQKQLCTSVAKGVRGVKAVNNNMAVEYDTQRSDSQIADEVAAVLANDVRVDDAMIYVDVNDGKVMLKGTVGSLSEKNTARALAWVSGVKEVNADGLDIKWWARDSMRRKEMYISRTDEQIQKAVEDALRYDPRVDVTNLDVSVKFGRVTLEGVVDNLSARKAAERDARNTMGASAVSNNIRVRFAENISEEEISKTISSRLQNDPYLDRFNLEAINISGTVYLYGNVNTLWEKNHAERVVERVKGVTGVFNNVTYHDNWSWKPDWEIKEDVESQFAWSPFVDGGDIDVSVRDGVVTLSGEVDTYSESQSAVDNAYEGGAKQVDNELDIDYDYYGPYHYGPYSPTYFYPYYTYYY